jgi:hypothetical protein
MRRSTPIFVLGMLAAAGVGASRQAPPPALEYLGLARPGSVPQVFAPGVVSTGDAHSRLTFSPDGREIFWTSIERPDFRTRILSVRFSGAIWSLPTPPAFAREGQTNGVVFTPDSRRLNFAVRIDGGWSMRYADPAGAGWSEPRTAAFVPDSSSSFTAGGRVYYSATLATKVWRTGIFSARYSKDGLIDAAPMGPEINVPNGIDYTPYVAPDESYLLFSSNRPAKGDKEDMHLYVSFRARDGNWLPPLRLFDVPGRFPSLSIDGRYLFFCGDDGNFYWVEAKAIAARRPQQG